jgi:hypothetical protein
VNCTGQQEVDYFWTTLTAGGGQVSPTILGEMLSDADPRKRAYNA